MDFMKPKLYSYIPGKKLASLPPDDLFRRQGNTRAALCSWAFFTVDILARRSKNNTGVTNNSNNGPIALKYPSKP